MTGAREGRHEWRAGVGTAMGMALGTAARLLAFDSLATGIAISVVLGVAVDASQARRS